MIVSSAKAKWAASVNLSFLLDDKVKWYFFSGQDCSDIRDNLLSVVPKIPSGIYIIHPDNTDASFEVDSRLDFVTTAAVTF